MTALVPTRDDVSRAPGGGQRRRPALPVSVAIAVAALAGAGALSLLVGARAVPFDAIWDSAHPLRPEVEARLDRTVLGLADSALDGELTRRLAPGREPLDEAETHTWLQRLDAAGVRAQAVARIADRHADALDALAALPQGAVRDELTRFADELAVRDA